MKFPDFSLNLQLTIMNRAEKKTKVIIIEDELHNSRMLNGMIQKLRPDWSVSAVLESVSESVDWLETNPQPDLILMDIQLSDGICFSIFDKVNLAAETRIIFTTAYDEYAIRAFKVNSIDYLLKPIKESELEFALTKFESFRESGMKNNTTYSVEKKEYDELIQSILSGKKEYRKRFLVSAGSNYYKLDTSEIAFIYSSNKSVFAVDFNRKESLLDYNLEQIESELNPEQFFRANRQIILNIDSVKKISNDSGGKLKVFTKPETDFEITISRLKAADFKLWLGK